MRYKRDAQVEPRSGAIVRMSREGEMIDDKDVRVTVRDGASIALRIYRPDGAGPFPALLAASPYRYDNNELPAYPLFLWRATGPIDWYVEQGSAYVHMDVPGTWTCAAPACPTASSAS